MVNPLGTDGRESKNQKPIEKKWLEVECVEWWLVAIQNEKEPPSPSAAAESTEATHAPVEEKDLDG